MTKTTFSRIATPVLFAVTLALGACKQGDKPEDALASDTSLAHDLQLANTDSAAQPQLKDVPATVETAGCCWDETSRESLLGVGVELFLAMLEPP